MDEVKPNISLVGLFCAAVFLVGLTSLLGFLGSLHWTAELFSHFRLQYTLACGTSALFFLIVLKRQKWCLAMTGLTLINLLPIIPFMGSPELDLNKPTLRIFTANVLTHNQQHESLVRQILAEDPDIIVLPKINRDWARSLRELSVLYPHQMILPQRDNFGMACLSKQEASLTRMDFVPNLVPSIVLETHLDQKPITIVATHPLPPMSGYNARKRQQQLDAIVAFVNTRSEPCVIVGDLNLTPFSPVMSDLLEKTNIPKSSATLKGTWPGRISRLGIPIDHVLAQEPLISNNRVGAYFGSDHLPVIADVQFGN